MLQRAGILVLVLLFAIAWAMPAKAAIAYRAVSTATTGSTTATSLAIAKPTGTTTDDVMIASLSVRGGTGVTMGTPAGWTQIYQDLSGTSIVLTTYYKVVTASESSTASYTFTFGSTGRRAAAAIVTYSGVNTNAPINASNGQANASSTTMTAPSITATVANAYVITAFGAATNGTATPPTGMTERYDTHSTNTTASNNAVAEGSDALQAAAGNTGTKTSALTTAAVNLGQTIALAPGASITQSTYHWYGNQDAVQPGASLAGENMPSTTNSSTPVRLRLGLDLGASDSLAAGAKSFKLQYGTSASGPWSDVANPGATPFPDGKITDPSPQPYGTGYAVAWSPDNTYLAIGDNTLGVYIAIYKRSGDTLTQLPAPATLPSSSPEDVAWSPDGNYVTFALDSSPYIATYKRSGDTFTLLPAPSTLPAGNGYSVSYTSTADGVYLAIAHATTPFVTIYKQSGDTLTKLANPSSLPASNGFSADFSSDGTYLAIGHATTPFVTIYKRSGDTFTKLADPASLPPQVSYGIAFSPDTNYLAMAIPVSPYIAIYSRSGDTFTKLANPDVLPTAAGEDIAWSSDSNHLTIAEDNSPYIINYDRNGTSFTKRADPATLPSASGEAVAYSSDGTYLAVRTTGTTPSLVIYKSQPSEWMYQDNPTPVNGATISSALLSGTPVRESYNEANPTVVNPAAIGGGQRGEWDFPLLGSGASSGNTYYFRMTEADGTPLKTYSAYPQLAIDNSQLTQSSYRFFENEDVPVTGVAEADGSPGKGDRATSIAKTSDGGYVVTGYTASFSAGGDSDIILNRYDNNGTLLWSKVMGGTGNESGEKVVQTADGGYAVAGETASYGGGGTDAFVARFDGGGTLQWMKTFGDSGTEDAYGIANTSSGGLVVTGDTTTYGAGSGDAFIIVLSSTGTVQWTRQLGGTSYEYGTGVIQTSDGGYAMVGVDSSFGSGGQDLMLAKYNSSGTLQWTRDLGGTGYETSASSLVQTSDGGFTIAGATQSNAAGGVIDQIIAHYSSTGTYQWARTVGGPIQDYGEDIILTSDGGYAVAGDTNSFTSGGDYDAMITRYDSAGTLLWAKTIGGTGNDRAYSIVQNADGGFTFVGDITTADASGDMLFVTTDANGSIGGCASPTCQTPTLTVASPTPAQTSPTPTTNTLTFPSTSPAPTVTSPTMTAAPAAGDVVGAPLASQDTAARLLPDMPFRLRSRIAVDSGAAPKNGSSLKLQYEEKNGTCSASAPGYGDMTAGGSPLGYYDNASITDGDSTSASVNDPTNGARPTVLQSYHEANPFTTNVAAIPAGSDGLWDFALTSSVAADGKTYCLRVVKADGTLLSSYAEMPEITIGSGGPTLDQQLHGGESVINGVKGGFTF